MNRCPVRMPAQKLNTIDVTGALVAAHSINLEIVASLSVQLIQWSNAQSATLKTNRMIAVSNLKVNVFRMLSVFLMLRRWLRRQFDGLSRRLRR